jgi:hypothetical protein
MPKARARDISAMDPRVRHEAVQYIREWLPNEVRVTYRRLMASNPEGWHRHPHFSGGFFVNSVLRGNGLTEEALGVEDLGTVWRQLLALALTDD